MPIFEKLQKQQKQHQVNSNLHTHQCGNYEVGGVKGIREARERKREREEQIYRAYAEHFKYHLMNINSLSQPENKI